MKPKEFLHQLDEARIVQAIAQAEKASSGEIRVLVSSKGVENALATAEAEFTRLGMTKTRERNGVLLFFAPASQSFAVVGDVAVHQKCGDPFWQDITRQMSEQLRQNHFTEAVVGTVDRVGQLLAQHFPRSPDDTNELPNSVIRH